MKSKGEEKSFDIRELVCFGIELRESIYSTQEWRKNQINLKSNGQNLNL